MAKKRTFRDVRFVSGFPKVENSAIQVRGEYAYGDGNPQNPPWTLIVKARSKTASDAKLLRSVSLFPLPMPGESKYYPFSVTIPNAGAGPFVVWVEMHEQHSTDPSSGFTGQAVVSLPADAT